MPTIKQYEADLMEANEIISEWSDAVFELKDSYQKACANAQKRVERFMLEQQLSNTLDEILNGLTILCKRLHDFYIEENDHLEASIARKEKISHCFEIFKVISLLFRNNEPLEKIRYDLYMEFGDKVEDSLPPELQEMIFDSESDEDYQNAKKTFSQVSYNLTFKGEYSTLQEDINHISARLCNIKKARNLLLNCNKEAKKLKAELCD